MRQLVLFATFLCFSLAFLGAEAQKKPTSLSAADQEPFVIVIKDKRLLQATGQNPCGTNARITASGKQSYQVGGSVQVYDGKSYLWCDGAIHTWVGRHEDIEGVIAVIDSDKDDPLQFKVDKERGYVYQKGKGTVTMPDGKVISLPIRERRSSGGRQPDTPSLSADTKSKAEACCKGCREGSKNADVVEMCCAHCRMLSKTPAVTEQPALPLHPSPTQLADHYRDNGNGTVTDRQTGLQWMRCSLGQTWQGGTCRGEGQTYKWQAALDAAAALNCHGGYAGYRDWRVLTKEELRTLFCAGGQQTWEDIGRPPCKDNQTRKALHQSVFPNSPVIGGLRYWSSSVYASDPIHAWVIYSDGSMGGLYKTDDYPVRLVRGGQ